MNQKNQYLQNKKQIIGHLFVRMSERMEYCVLLNCMCAVVVFVRVRLSVCLSVSDYVRPFSLLYNLLNEWRGLMKLILIINKFSNIAL